MIYISNTCKDFAPPWNDGTWTERSELSEAKPGTWNHNGTI